MDLIPHPSHRAPRMRPGTGAGSVYHRVERRRPHDRRHQERPVYLDLRCSKQERRRQQRRSVYDPGRRQWPEPPAGLDLFV